MPNERNVSLAIVIVSLTIIVGVAIYMIAGGLMPSGTPTAEAPVSPPANPMR